MSRQSRFYSCLIAVLIAGTLSLTSCKNNNLFGRLHHPGDSSDTKTLISDANEALRQRNYQSSLDLFNRVLNNDPNNATALKGAAVAQLGVAGIDFGTLVANLSAQASASSL